MNERIEFYETKPVKNENGDYKNVDTVLFSCWAEVAKATTKEFKNRSTEKIQEIEKRKNVRVFYIRHQQKIPVDTGMKVKWRDKKYLVEDTEEDWRSKDMLMVSVVLVE